MNGRVREGRIVYLSIRCGEVKRPVCTPPAFSSAERYAHTVPLPLVPATWTAFHGCGLFLNSWAARCSPSCIIKSVVTWVDWSIGARGVSGALLLLLMGVAILVGVCECTGL